MSFDGMTQPVVNTAIMTQTSRSGKDRRPRGHVAQDDRADLGHGRVPGDSPIGMGINMLPN
jgi:hypothetical protein